MIFGREGYLAPILFTFLFLAEPLLSETGVVGGVVSLPSGKPRENSGSQTGMVAIAGASYVPLYGAKELPTVSVPSFFIDRKPVTQGDFLAFVKKSPEWQKSQVKRIFAEKSYLQDWPGDLQIPNGSSDMPITNVSWYAARAYCRSRGLRLPMMDEWELVAMANESKRDAREDPAFIKGILSGYETPHTRSKKVGSSPANYYGIFDLHGLVWEWVLDFNSVIISGESRNDGDTGLFCAAGAAGATDLMNYAAFMRYAFRNSLKANFAIKNLGFRCAKDALEESPDKELE